MSATRMGTAAVLTALLVGGCTGTPASTGPPSPAGVSGPDSVPSARASPGPPTASATGPAASSATRSAGPAPSVRPGDLRVATATAAVRHLAGRIGPRHGTSEAYRRAARWVRERFAALGYDVRRQPFRVPGGTSWDVPVPAGRSWNVIADPPWFDPGEPHLLVGAHLDTVPQAPGAEDNASGVGVLLAVAEAIGGRRTRLPVRLVAFGAEEPRGPGDDDHHYGSRHFVREMSRAERRALRGMVSLDRVGVGTVLPVCSAGPGPTPLRRALLRAARRADVRAVGCVGNRASDHWSFVRSGLPGARLGSTSYPAYHSPQDVPAVVNPAQLRRAGRTTLAWITGR